MFVAQLRYFATLANELNYLSAASKLHIPQPALCDAIQELEAELGIPLFRRKGYAVELTAGGSEFCSHAARALDELGKGIELACARTAQLAGNIKVGTSGIVTDGYLASLFQDYSDTVTNSVEFELYHGYEASLVEGLRKELYDVLFVKDPSAESQDLTYRRMASRHFALCVSREHPFAKQAAVSFTQLQSSRIITYDQDSVLGREANRALMAAHLSAQRCCESGGSIAEAVLHDRSAVGLVILPVASQVARDTVLFPVEGIGYDLGSVYVVFRKSDSGRFNIESFVEHAQAFMARSALSEVA